MIQENKPVKISEKIALAMEESIRVKEALLKNPKALSLLQEMGLAGQNALKNGKKILFAGNGGSFADSMHLAAELVSRLCTDRMALASIALGCGNSNLTAIGNDYGYQFTFSREIEALGQPGDVLIAISTSGNSPNILEAVKTAKAKDLIVYGWSGETGGKLAEEVTTLCIPSRNTARIQESHILCGHIFCEIVEAPFLSAKS
jgi:D-sedoheptulose 7-phosphate isomerase